MATLESQTSAFKANAYAQMPPATVRTITDWIGELSQSGIVGRSLQVGQAAPDFALPNAHGQTVTLTDLLASGPVVVTFYRGAWCPFCNLALKAYQDILPEIKALGASFVAVSPQTPDNSLTMAEKNALSYEVLSDAGNAVARQFGIVYKFSDAMYDVQTNAFGVDLPSFNGDDSRELPLPGTFVIDRGGTITLAQVFIDVSERVEPSAILDALHGLA
jgi:peroxiredoxin